MTTSEMHGAVSETTKEQDMSVYTQLKDKAIEDVDYIELEYGTQEKTFNNSKSFIVNLETKELEVIYYTEDELKNIESQNQAAQDLNDRVSDISTYLNNSDETTIADIENSILEIEKNKILEGMI